MEKSFTDSNIAKSAMRDLDSLDGKQDLSMDMKKTELMNGQRMAAQTGMIQREMAFQDEATPLSRQDRYKFLRSKLRYEFMTPDDQIEGREITPRDILLAFDDVTSTHGIPHIKYARGPIKRIFWILATITAVIGLILNLWMVTENFVTHPVSVGIAIQHANDIEFPAITICNMSPVKKSAAANQMNVAQSKRRRKRSTGSAANCCCTCCAMTNESSAADACGTCGAGLWSSCGSSQAPSPTVARTTAAAAAPTEAETRERTTAEAVDETPPDATPTDPPPRKDFLAEETLTETLALLPAAQRRLIGFTMNDLILDCQYAGSTCDPAWFVQFQNPIHGNCYIFNSGWNSTDLLISHRTGRRFGLSMTLNINQADYVKDAGDTAGIRVVAHQGDRIPFPEDEGLTVSPGHSTSIGLQKVLISRLGSPYSVCVDTADKQHNFNRNAYEEQYKDTLYSPPACSKTCYQRNVISQCQCGDPSYPLEGVAFGGPSWKPCSMSNATEDNCRSKVLSDYNNNVLTCNCPNLCVDTLYATSVSIGQWPSNIQLEPTLKSVESKVSFDVFDNVTYKDNLIKMEIYFEEFNFQHISESPGYVLESYFSDIGGVLGLYLGMSFMSCLEFIELATDLIIFYAIKWTFILRYWKQLQKVSPSMGPPSGGGHHAATDRHLEGPETMGAAQGVMVQQPDPMLAPPAYPGDASLYDAYDTPISFRAGVALRRTRRGRVRPDNIREILLNM